MMRNFSMLISIAIAILLVTTCHATEAVGSRSRDKSSFSIMLPDELKSEEGLPHSEALFGIPPYGGNKRIIGEVVYATGKDDTETGCDNYKLPDDLPSMPVFLVDRGDCTFVSKVRKAQGFGAAATIIADTICQCENADHKKEEVGHTEKLLKQCEEAGKANQGVRLPLGKNCENTLPYMADDGSGGDVSIPSFLIDHYDAQRIKDCYLSARDEKYDSVTGVKCDKDVKIMVTLKWDMPTPDGNVDYELWTSSDSEAEFKKGFEYTAIKLKDHTTFRPHYFTWHGDDWNCNIANICLSQCTKGGHYCNPDPDKDLMHGVSGKDVVEENLRQICVWKQAEPHYHEDGAKMWWEYVIKFAEKCHPNKTPDSSHFNEQCSKDVHREVEGLEWAKTVKCVKDSWEGDHTNHLLDEEINAAKNAGIVQLPTLFVNGVVERGGVRPISVLSTICSGFAPGTAPKLCSCVEKSTSTKLAECVESICPPDKKFCAVDNLCYGESEYARKCTTACSYGQYYCQSLGACMLENSDRNCPECPSDKPFYCTQTNACTSDSRSCKAEDGMSALGVVFIVLSVVSLVGLGFFIYFRRQRKKMHEEVRNILSEYMPLEEFDARNGTSNAPPASSNGGSSMPVNNNSALGLI